MHAHGLPWFVFMRHCIPFLILHSLFIHLITHHSFIMESAKFIIKHLELFHLLHDGNYVNVIVLLLLPVPWNWMQFSTLRAMCSVPLPLLLFKFTFLSHNTWYLHFYNIPSLGHCVSTKWKSQRDDGMSRGYLFLFIPVT